MVNDPISLSWDLFQRIFHTFLQPCISLCRTQSIEILGHSSHIFRNGHIIIVEDNDKITFQSACIVQCLVCHSSGHRTVSDDRNHTVGSALKFSCRHISKSCGNRSRTMPCIKGITFTLFSFWKSTHSPVFSQFIKPCFSPRQQLMRVSLMSYVPDQLILWKIKDKMKCHRQFHNPQIRCQVTSGHTDLLDQKLSDLICKHSKFLGTEIFYIIFLMDLLKYHQDSSFYFSLYTRDFSNSSRKSSFAGNFRSRSTASCVNRSTSSCAFSIPFQVTYVVFSFFSSL